MTLLALPVQAHDFTLFVTGGKSVTTWHGQADLQSVGVEWTRRAWTRTDVGVTFAPQILWQPRSWFGDQYADGSEKVRALATTLLVRHRIGSRRPYRPYVEISSGPMWSEKRVPAATSHFNFISSVGFGVVLRSGTKAPVLIGYRYSHISNGGYSPRNPGLDVSSLVLGIQLYQNRVKRRRPPHPTPGASP